MENGGAHVERHLFVAVAQIAAIHAYLQEQSNRSRHMPKYVDNLLSQAPDYISSIVHNGHETRARAGMRRNV